MQDLPWHNTAKSPANPVRGKASMRGQFQTVSAGEMSAFSVAGLLIRYGFYAIGMLVFGMVGIGILSVWKIVPKVVNDPPAFRIASGEFAGKPSSGHVQVSSQYGRVEVVQYGELNNRSTDLAVIMVLPPPDSFIAVRLVQDMTDINLLHDQAAAGHVERALRPRYALRRVARHRDARRDRRPLEAVPVVPQPVRRPGGAAGRLVLATAPAPGRAPARSPARSTSW